MHRKIIVIDDSLVWLGSANLTSASLRRYDNLLMGLHAPAIAQLITAKAEDIIYRRHPKETPSNDFLIEGQRIEFWFLPEDIRALDRLLQLIREAQKTLRVAMYTWTHPLIAHEVINARNRGVDVEIALDRQMSHGANAPIVRKLQAQGIRMGFNQSSQLLHHKFAYIDENILVMGSANWTKAAFTRNEDCFIVLHELTDKQKSIMNTLWYHIRNESQIPSCEDREFLPACGI